MATAARIKRYLEKNHVPFGELQYPREGSLANVAGTLGIPFSNLLKCELVMDTTAHKNH